MNKQFLIVDTETTSVDPLIAEIKVFGAYDPYEDKHYIYKWNDTNIAKIVELVSQYQNIITFNGLKYDLPILARHGIPITFKHIDIYDVFKNKRKKLLPTFDSYSLKALILQLQLDSVGKKEIDYEIFKKNNWTAEEQAQIISYLKQDLILTWKLWEYLLKRFKPFEAFIPEKDKILYKHITIPLELLSYKIICHGAKVIELYDQKPRPKTFPQPIITRPRKELSTNAALFQFTKLYTHIIMQFNLVSSQCECCIGNEGKFHGKNFYNIKGHYCQKNHGRIERFLKQLCIDASTDKDSRLVANIVFSNMYAVFTNPLFYSTYDPNAAYDMYLLTKQQLKIMVRKFEDAGFLVVYIDIDNVFIHMPEGKTISDLLSAKNSILEYLKTKMPFPSETFDLVLCEELSYLKFFQNPNPKDPFLRKGEYVYINKEGFLTSRGVTQDVVQEVLAEVV